MRQQQCSGDFYCGSCGAPVHEWTGLYAFCYWKPVTIIRRSGRRLHYGSFQNPIDAALDVGGEAAVFRVVVVNRAGDAQRADERALAHLDGLHVHRLNRVRAEAHGAGG